MQSLVQSLATGAALGLAGSLHCACMCGSIASGGLFFLPPDRGQRLRALLSAQAGRVATYAVLGALSSSLIAIFIGSGVGATGGRVLQWLGSAALIGAGLSIAGLLPPVPLAGLSFAWAAMPAAFSPLAPVRQIFTSSGIGIAWGLTPCPLVYAALLNASLTGPPAEAATFMLGFGIGTVPSIVATTLGLHAIRDLRKSRVVQVIGGIAIAMIGLATLKYDLHAQLICAANR